MDSEEMRHRFEDEDGLREEPEEVVPPPWWVWLAAVVWLPRCRNPPAFSARQWRVLGILSLVSLFERFDEHLYAMNIPFVQRDLGIAEENLGRWTALVRLGEVPSLGIMPVADAFGRRSTLLWTVIFLTGFTVATAFSTTPLMYVSCQFGARLFARAEALLSIVVINEETPARERGWAVGALIGIAALGYALAISLFAGVEYYPGGWRFMYGLSGLMLAGIALIRRFLPETRRFERQVQRVVVWHPVASLWRRSSFRVVVVGLGGFLLGVGGTVGDALGFKFLQERFDMKPYHYTILAMGTGGVAIGLSAVMGQTSDKHGRRRSLMVAILLAVVGGIAYFQNRIVYLLPFVYCVWVFAGTSLGVLWSTYSAELFPTGHRATAIGVIAVLTVIGSAVGLWLESVLYGAFTSSTPLDAHVHSMSIIRLVMLPSLCVVGSVLPETAGIDLDELHGEEDGMPE